MQQFAFSDRSQARESNDDTHFMVVEQIIKKKTKPKT
jgi:hypothetical protein